MSPDLTTAADGDVVAEAQIGPLTREQLHAYAQASGDLNPLHLDPAFAKKAGFEDVIVHGMLGMAVLGRLLTGPLGQYPLKTFDARFGAIIPVGRVLTCRATLASRQGDTVTLRLEALDAAGKATISGSAQLALAAT